RVRHARGQAFVAALPESARKPFGADPGLAHWAPVVEARAESRGKGQPPAHWALVDGAVRHFPGHGHDYLYFRVPLRGDFEVNAELTTFNSRRADLGYGGVHLSLKWDRKGYDLFNLTRKLRTAKIEPPLPELGDWYKYRLVVKGGQWTAYVGDRKLCEEPLPADPDPWLMVYAPRAHLAGARNLSITGSPTVPESLRLSDAADLSAWYSYEGLGVMGEGGAWQKRGEEIVAQGQRPKAPDDRPAPPRAYSESAMFY